MILDRETLAEVESPNTRDNSLSRLDGGRGYHDDALQGY